MGYKHNKAAREKIAAGVKAAWVGRKRKSPVTRFWEKVDRTPRNGCWVWFGARDRNGYGQLRVKPDTVKAHRYSWELLRGPIPDGLILLHSCDNRNCVNPDHLRVGTYRDNVQDAIAKGRMPHAVPQKFCQRGHPRIPENRVYSKSGKSRCRECGKIRSAEWYSRQKMIRGHV